MGTQQKELLSIPPSPDGSVFVSDRVSFRTEGTQRVICVHGVVFAHYGVEDRTAEVYAMITLSESGYASQTHLARSFGYSVRSLRRYQERFEAGGVGALVRGPGRPSGRLSGNSKQRGRDQTILHLKTRGSSNRVQLNVRVTLAAAEGRVSVMPEWEEGGCCWTTGGKLDK